MTQNTFLPENILIPHFKDKPVVGAEIGVLGASGSVAMLLRMPNLTLYCIDPWKHFERDFEAANPQEWHDEMYEHSKNRLKEFGARAKILRMTSDEAWYQVPEVDFVWIDGDHSEDTVRKDIQNWKQKVKKGGIIGGHDYQISYIAKIVKEELGEVQTGEDFTWFKYL